MAGDPERQLAGPPQGLADRPMPPGWSDQEQEAAAAGPQELAADGAGPARRLVPLIDLVVADPAPERPLQLPPLVQQGREPVQVPFAGQSMPHLVGQVPHRTEHIQAVRRRLDCRSRIWLASRVWPV